MARHLKEFNVKCFRGIKNLQLQNMNDINILTGDNNAGKTSVLEVINYLSGITDLRNLIYGTRKAMNAVHAKEMSEFDKLMFLFPADNGGNQTISYTFTLKNEDVKVKINKNVVIETLSREELKELSYRSDYFIPYELLNQNISFDIRKMNLSFYVNDKKITKSFHEFARTIYSNENEYHYIDTTYISPIKHADSTVHLSQIFDNPILYGEMLEILKEFDEGIISINADKLSEYSSATVYSILSKYNDKAIPLNFYGDGMKKAILLISSVISAKNGILLLDEFETAIHTTAMNCVFEWILKACMKFNVQLFLTSHSLEAIEKVLKCCPDLSDHINLYTLYRKGNQTLVRSLSCAEAIEANDKLGLELR